MHLQPTVLLQHVTRTGRHHDWLMGDPTVREPYARLWTARVGPASGLWLSAGRLTLTELSPHRRAYLDYQGPVSGGRGVVRRVDAGVIRPLLWTDRRRVLEVRMRYHVGWMELRRLTADRWLGLTRAHGRQQN